MKEQTFVFTKTNYLLMAAGVILMIFGYILMQGGGSDNPEVFNPEIFSARRITWAPMVLLSGLLVEVVAIMYRPKNG
ncbi:MAG: hypothetical protein CMH28_10400 [Micavibrio sp.]|nr:hypothetical protein [Micavibrio sp.]